MSTAQIFIAAYIMGVFCGLGWGFAAGASQKDKETGRQDGTWKQR